MSSEDNLGTVKAPDADLRDEEANVPTPAKNNSQKEKSTEGKWRAIALFFIVASIIAVIVVPPSVIIPRKGEKASSFKKLNVSPITEAEIEAAQKAWGDALVKISSTYSRKGHEAAKEVAQEVLDAAYGYSIGMAVSFKPTLAYGDQTFRTTNEGALSYFVGNNSNYPHDHGFALKNWTDVISIRAGVIVDPSGDFALSMGNVFFKNDKNEVTKVDKTWGYYKDASGALRIILHHSSLPYVPDPATVEPNLFPQTQVKALNEVHGLVPSTKEANPITLAEIESAQTEWCNALLNISSTYSTQGIETAKTTAQQVLDAAYGYKVDIKVLFKPTLASGDDTFRLTNEGALSYFVGNNSNHPHDHGFALKSWVNCTSVRSSMYLHPSGDIAFTMGNVIFGNKDGTFTIVDKTWAYFKGDDRVTRIILHHSSLPYVPASP